jgi:ribonuclease E
VELLAGRLPNATSAAAVIQGRIVEVENAANMAGQTARIRLIDVAEDSALAELAAAAAAEKKKRRRRRGGKGEISAAEQTQQLRELAEEAAKFSQARPPIGITTITEEEERQDKAVAAEVKAERAPEAIVIAEGEVRALAGGAQPFGEGHKRRRRRRRGRGGRSEDFTQAAHAGISAESALAQVETSEEREEVMPAHPAGAGHTEIGEGGRRRRRRRRRRRGRGPGAEAPMPGAPTAMPDRHIFRVGADGSAEPTGQTAPREPVRAIAPWNRKAQPPAVEPPPPHLRAPDEHAKPTKPARRRRGVASEAPATAGGELASSRTAALPAPEAPAEKPKRARKSKAAPAAVAQTAVAEKPKRARKTAAESETQATPAKATRKPKAEKPEGAVKKTGSTRKATAKKTTTRKKKA